MEGEFRGSPARAPEGLGDGSHHGACFPLLWVGGSDQELPQLSHSLSFPVSPLITGSILQLYPVSRGEVKI